MEIGIVGLPNVGKSTLFNALTGAGIAAENFPFTTIDPNVGIVPIPDERLNALEQMWESAKVTPAGIRFVDIAGLVKGASRGEGLGNKFLANIREVDAICHVVRCFHNEDVVNVTGDLDPVDAADIIETELLLADLQQGQKALERAQKMAKSGEPAAKDRAAMFAQIVEKFDQGVPARQQEIPQEVLKEYPFLTAKPLLYVANIDENGAAPELIGPLKERAQQDNAGLIEICTKLEAEILELPEEDRSMYYEEAGIVSPGLGRLARAGQELLGLICFFTAGPQEARAWLIPQNTPAAKAAGKIHTDMERGFIRAEVYKFDDAQRLDGYNAVKDAGLVTLEGKDYPIKDGDVVFFRFSV
ncbi:MAG: redox-regulated ATPase YchF [Candidatus Omnitrophota bacterium]